MSVKRLDDVINIYANLSDVSDAKSFRKGSVVGSNESMEHVIDKEIEVVDVLTDESLSIFECVDDESDSPDA